MTRWRWAVGVAGMVWLVVAGSMGRVYGQGVGGEGVRMGRFEALPEGVCAVLAGPDQRLWYIKTPTAGGGLLEVAGVKAQVAEQWKAGTPVLRDCSPVLFEKGGAVWFVTGDRRTLLRYDGEQWIEHAVHVAENATAKFTGVCPGYGRTSDYAYNLEAGGMRMFMETEGISVFDGKEWTYQKLQEDSRWGFMNRMVVLPEKDGKSVLVLSTLRKSLWRCTGGKWARVELPAWCKKEEISSAALAADGALWLGMRGGIHVVPVDGRKVAATLPAYLPGLTEDLAELKINDLDVNQYWAGLTQDEVGNIFVGVSGLASEMSKTHKGMFVVSKAGRARFCSGAAVRFDMYGGSAPLISDGGRTIWCASGLYGGDERVCWVDLRGEVAEVHKPVSEVLRFAQSVAADGRAFLSVDDPLRPYKDESVGVIASVVAYRATEVDDRRVIRPASYPAAGGAAVAVGSDGVVWAQLAKQGLCRFDGREWRKMWEPETDVIMTLFPGQARAMLCWGVSKAGERFILWQGDKRVEGTDLAALIKENPEAFKAAFGGRLDPGLWAAAQGRFFYNPMVAHGRVSSGWSIAVDQKGRIWLTMDRILQVLDAGEWVRRKWSNTPKVGDEAEQQWPTCEANDGVSMVVAVGDGEAMYLVDHRGEHSPPGKACVAKYVDGEIQWTPAASPRDGLMRDVDGALWVAYRQTTEGKDAGNSAGKFVVERLDGSGSTVKQVLPEPPAMLDRSGIMWLARRGERGMRSGEFLLWKGGEVVGHARAPGVWNEGSLVSDKAGSVWVWTNLGLHHLTAEDPGRAEYKVRNMGVVDGGGGDMFNLFGMSLAWSGQGLVTTGAFTEGHMTSYKVMLLPTDGR